MNKVHFRFHDSHIVLRAALQNEARAQSREIRNAGHVEEYVLGKHCGQTGKNFFRAPALALEIHDVRLHEDGTAVAEDRHRLRRESQVGVLFDAQAKTFGCGLQEISVARGALGVEFEVFYSPVMEDDDFDVLTADIDDDVGIFVELQRRFGVRNSFHQCHVSVQNIFQDVLCVTRGGDSQDFQLGLLRFHLAAQVLEHLDRVLNGVAIRELVGLA